MPLALALEGEMAVDGGIAKLESDLGQVRSDITDIKKDLGSLRSEVAKEFGILRSEMAAGLAAATRQTADLGTHCERQFGILRESIANLKIEVTNAKLWMLVTGISTVLGVAAVVGLKVH